MEAFEFIASFGTVTIENISSGVVIYKQYKSTSSNPLNFQKGRAKCNQDSDAVSASGFLHMPMPRSEAENQIYHELVKDKKKNTYLDIAEVQPPTSPRSWKLKDGTPATWFNWAPGQPGTKSYITMLRDTSDSNTGLWMNSDGTNGRNIVCTYFLPAYSVNYCSWLRNFED